MEHELRQKALKVLAGAATILILGTASGALQIEPFYNVDTEIRIQGTVREILFEVRYKGRSPFMVIALDEKDTGQKFRIDISPSWFFDEDLHKGEKVEIVGSLVRSADDGKHVIAREVRLRGETLILRDTRGFPEWRGGGTARGARRRGRNR